VTRFCCDCRHGQFFGVPLFVWECFRDGAPRDPVTGAFPSCRSQRKSDDACGPSGRYFAVKPVEPQPAQRGWKFWLKATRSK
jgi:hypothetical protein